MRFLNNKTDFNHNTSKLLILVVIMVSFIYQTKAQDSTDNQNTVINQQIWIDFYPHYYMNEKIEYYGDAGYRTMINQNEWSRIYARPSLRYHLSKKWELQGGVGVFYIFYSNNIDQFEVRPWQGVQFNGTGYKRIKFKNSLKLEERWSYLTDTWDADLELRLRYKLSGVISLRNKWAIPFYGEAFLPLSGNVKELYQNQGRAGVGISYNATKDWKFAFLMHWQRSKAGINEDVGVSDYVYQLKIIKKWKRLIGNKA